MPARFKVTNEDAPKAKLLTDAPKDIHVADAAFINEQVGAEVVTPKQVQVCKVLLMAAQAARREDAPAPKAAKATTTAKAAKATPAKGRAAAAKAGPKAKAASTTKAGTAKGRQRAARGAQAAESTTAAEPSADAPF